MYCIEPLQEYIIVPGYVRIMSVSALDVTVEQDIKASRQAHVMLMNCSTWSRVHLRSKRSCLSKVV